MEFDANLIEGRLIRRYKRFLADVELRDGRIVTVHTPNTGSMMGCSEPGLRVWLRDTGNSSRKYPLSWELVEDKQGTLIGINTGLANQLVVDAIFEGLIAALQGYAVLRREVPYGERRSRIDILLQDPSRLDCYVEVKNVTLLDEGMCARFPDAVTARGTRHLHELQAVAAAGCRAVMVFCVQRGDAKTFAPADTIDPQYGAQLRAAARVGVELMAYQAAIDTRSIRLVKPLPIVTF